MKNDVRRVLISFFFAVLLLSPASAQIGRRFPSEKKVVIDPVTGTSLTFLTSTPVGDSKIYQTHPQWTSDGKWLVFRSARVAGQAFAVNEENGAIVQLTEAGYLGMLCLARKSMHLYLMRDLGRKKGEEPPPVQPAEQRRAPKGPFEVVDLDLGKLFSDSEANRVGPESAYERVCGMLPEGMKAAGDMALDADEKEVYFRITGADVGSHFAEGTKIEPVFGPRKMGAGPAGLRSMDVKTGEIKFIVDVPFQIGHVQTNPFVSGEIVFCWETGGKSPQRTWIVRSDGSSLRPLYPEAPYEWVTHEAVITKDEVAFALMGHRKLSVNDAWGISGTREHPTGLAIANLRTREMRIIAQTPSGSGLWHVNGSADGRWAVGDDFSRSIYLIDRHTSEMIMLSTGHKPTAADHPHPTFNADGTKIEIESAMLSADNKAMNICIIPVPAAWLARHYSESEFKPSAIQ